ncbi:MAG: hypothetical protein B1H05_04075 [Candidatus Cloacimonas sp. 4484_140]|nr:MAG: hypothetical protein B1H05_04075 [Candidatus Cloacimonas sp. 4484_140]HHI88284.1 hypothetical protein [Candidatus Cloacimonadota bacterium]
MNLLLFVIVIIISFTVVRIGAVAFELTGLEWSIAKFQALSCFTGTGFTTKESELIVKSHQRRKIAKILMIFGHAGLVTLIATFVNSMRPSQLVHKVFQPIIHLDKLPTLSVLINIVIIALFCWIIFSLFSHTKFSQKLTKVIQNFFLKKNIITRTYVQDLVTSAGGFGIVNIEVTDRSELYHLDMASIIKKYPVMKVIAIERGRNIITNLTNETRILLGDNIISYGKIDEIKKVLHQRLIDKVKDSVSTHKKKNVKKKK